MNRLAFPALLVLACTATTADAQSTGPTFVFQPGGAASGNVYADWPTLAAAESALPGSKWITFDGSHAAGAVHVPAGTWNVDGCTFASRIDPVTGSDFVFFDDGAHLVFGALEFDHFFGENESTTPVVDLSAGQLYIAGGYSNLYSDTGKAPFLRVSGSGVATVDAANGFGIGDGTMTAVQVDSPGALSLMASDSYVFDGALAGNGEIDLMYDSAALLGSWAATNVHRSAASVASQVAYAPGDPSKWAVPAPATVQAAIDRIAARLDGGL